MNQILLLGMAIGIMYLVIVNMGYLIFGAYFKAYYGKKLGYWECYNIFYTPKARGKS